MRVLENQGVAWKGAEPSDLKWQAGVNTVMLVLIVYFYKQYELRENIAKYLCYILAGT
jgi:hypothetical protein